MATDKLTNVFIVDDSEIERSMLSDHLAKYQHLKIREFSSGDLFIKEFIMGNLEDPDLVLMDYFLDGSGGAKDGLDILTKLKEISPDTKVIMLTSVQNEKIIDLAKKKGALDYIIKSSVSYNQLDDVLTKHFKLKTQNQD
jgi:DNA-binding NarL/FixJ family response regulator